MTIIFDAIKKSVFPGYETNVKSVSETDKYYRVFYNNANNAISVSTVYNKADYSMRIVAK